MQQNVDKFVEAYINFGLMFSMNTTEVMHQPAAGKSYTEPTITMNGLCLKAVDKYTYLGSTLWRNVVIDDEAAARLANDSSCIMMFLLTSSLEVLLIRSHRPSINLDII